LILIESQMAKTHSFAVTGPGSLGQFLHHDWTTANRIDATTQRFDHSPRRR